MTVANALLCRRLYELSGWQGDVDFNELGDYPKYTLGYLREKLALVDVNALFAGNMLEAVKYNDKVKRALFRGEDSTAELAIALFVTGVLKK